MDKNVLKFPAKFSYIKNRTTEETKRIIECRYCGSNAFVISMDREIVACMDCAERYEFDNGGLDI